jgi:hypothetical protein
MSEPLTDAQLGELRKAVEKMTPGPWRYYEADNIIVDPGNLRTLFSFQPRGVDHKIHGEGIVALVNAWPSLLALLEQTERQHEEALLAHAADREKSSADLAALTATGAKLCAILTRQRDEARALLEQRESKLSAFYQELCEKEHGGTATMVDCNECRNDYHQETFDKLSVLLEQRTAALRTFGKHKIFCRSRKLDPVKMATLDIGEYATFGERECDCGLRAALLPSEGTQEPHK